MSTICKKFLPEEIPCYYTKEWANLKYFLPGYYERWS